MRLETRLKRKLTHRSLSSPVCDTVSNFIWAAFVFSSHFSRSSSSCCSFLDREANSFSACQSEALLVLFERKTRKLKFQWNGNHIDSLIIRSPFVFIFKFIKMSDSPTNKQKSTHIVQNFLFGFKIFVGSREFVLWVHQVLLNLRKTLLQSKSLLFGLQGKFESEEKNKLAFNLRIEEGCCCCCFWSVVLTQYPMGTFAKISCGAILLHTVIFQIKKIL